MAYCLVGLEAAALWVVGSVDFVKVSYETDLLGSHLDQTEHLAFEEKEL